MTGVKRPLTLWFPGMRFMAKALYGIDIADVSPARAIARSDTPVLVIHGEEDGVIPVEHARLLGRAIGASFDEIESGEETVWTVPGAGHTGAFRTQPEIYIDKVATFFERHLSAPVAMTRAGCPGVQATENGKPGWVRPEVLFARVSRPRKSHRAPGWPVLPATCGRVRCRQATYRG